MFEAIHLHATYIYIDVYPEFIAESEKSERNHAKIKAKRNFIAEECGPKMELLKWFEPRQNHIHEAYNRVMELWQMIRKTIWCQKHNCLTQRAFENRPQDEAVLRS